MEGPHVKNVVLTGPPGCGKTTAVLRLVERLPGLRLAGFYTQELREGGIRVMGPNCIGLVNLTDRVALTFEPLSLPPQTKGRGIGVVTQSGAMCSTLRRPATNSRKARRWPFGWGTAPSFQSLCSATARPSGP